MTEVWITKHAHRRAHIVSPAMGRVLPNGWMQVPIYREVDGVVREIGHNVYRPREWAKTLDEARAIVEAERERLVKKHLETAERTRCRAVNYLPRG